MIDFLLTLHGEVRWLVAVAGLAAIVRFTVGWVRGGEFGRLDRGLMGAFSGLLDVNLLLGLILLVGLEGGLPRQRLEHFVTMLLAIVIAHASVIWRRSDDSATKFRNNVAVIFAALMLVAVGVIRLRGGWLF